MSDPSGRVKLIRAGDLLQPGVCAMCRRQGYTNDEMFVDPHISIEWEGEIYFCPNCIAEMASILGLGPVVPLKLDLQRKSQQIVELQASVTAKEQVIDNLSTERLLSRSTSAHIISGLSSLVSDEAKQEAAGLSDETAESDSGGSRSDSPEREHITSRESKSKKSTDVKGLPDISELNSDNDSFDKSSTAGLTDLSSLGL